MKAPKPDLAWSSLYLITFLAATLYIFMEWLFAITRPSYMNNLGLGQQVQVFLFASGLLGIVCFLLLSPLAVLSFLPRLKPYQNTLIKIGLLLPALIFAALILILVDNFTYTLYRFGIVSTTGLSRVLYILGFLLAAILCYRSLLGTMHGLSQHIRVRKWSPKWIFGLLIGALLLFIAIPAITNRFGISTTPIARAAEAAQRPNILLITSDGVDANHMSVYGYARDTTPNLRALAGSALVAENAFSNAGPTAGSVIAIYTGKYPAETRLLYPPDILKGVDAYQHLPGILRSLGYKTAQFTLPHFLDAYELNLLDGFDEANGRSAVQSQFLSAANRVLPSDYAVFTYDLSNRLLDRLRHIFFLKRMTNPYDLVAGKPGRFVDQQRLESLRQALTTAEKPVFVHIHLMVTHGDTFEPPQQKFSAGQEVEDQEPWSVDFYDDTILEFDRDIGNLVKDLTEQGLLDKTVLVIGSDHGQKWDQLQRLPLIFRFPNGQHAGRLQANAQNLDIAPTLLDYLGVDQPDWMSGQSLISGELKQRPIFGVSSQGQEPDQDGEFVVNWEKISAPFYQFGELTLVDCQTWFRLDLTDLDWESGIVAGSTAACPPDSVITDEVAFQLMVEHLAENGFDVASLDSLPSKPPDSN